MSDYFNSFANPQSGGGQDIPPYGTPAWYQWMQGVMGGPMAGQIPGRAMGAVATPVGGQPPPSSAFTAAGSLGGDIPVTPSINALVNKGVGSQAIVAQPPPVSAPGGKQPDSSRGVQQPKPPVKRPPPGPLATPAAATDDSMLYPFKAIGEANPPAPSGAALAPDAAGLPASAVAAQAAQRAAAPADATPDASINAHIAMGSGAYGVPGSPSTGATPNLGYYRPTSGIAQGPGTWMQYGANDPRMFRGPLASQPTAAAAAPPPPAAPAAAAGTPGPIAPGVGTLWLRKLFGGGQPTAA